MILELESDASCSNQCQEPRAPITANRMKAVVSVCARMVADPCYVHSPSRRIRIRGSCRLIRRLSHLAQISHNVHAHLQGHSSPPHVLRRVAFLQRSAAWMNKYGSSFHRFLETGKRKSAPTMVSRCLLLAICAIDRPNGPLRSIWRVFKDTLKEKGVATSSANASHRDISHTLGDHPQTKGAKPALRSFCVPFPSITDIPPPLPASHSSQTTEVKFLTTHLPSLHRW
jgi:hypothetical protein